MPYKVEVDPQARIATLTGTVTPSPRGGQAALVELAEHPDYEPGFGIFCDFRRIVIPPDPDTVIAGSQNVVRFKPLLRGPMAVVVSPELELHSEIYLALFSAAGFEARSFGDPDEALAWLKGAMASETAA